MRVVATIDQRYGTRKIRKGEIFDVPDHHGKLLKLIRKADDAPPEIEIPSYVPAPRKRRTYRRRDMTAE